MILKSIPPLVSTLFLYASNSSNDQLVVDRPDGFEFKNHGIVSGQKTFTVDGELVNTQDDEWIEPSRQYQL
ncbi:MAG TPA: hypothetical protein EYO59_09645 [Chromatiaceae bacterium]|nr:hypothetical protein [Chromatiaceae bacterium]